MPTEYCALQNNRAAQSERAVHRADGLQSAEASRSGNTTRQEILHQVLENDFRGRRALRLRGQGLGREDLQSADSESLVADRDRPRHHRHLPRLGPQYQSAQVQHRHALPRLRWLETTRRHFLRNKLFSFPFRSLFLLYLVQVLREDGSKASAHELGRIVVKLPLPPGTMSTLYLAPDRFKENYFSKYPGFYDTMDAGYIDEFGYVYVTARDDDVINVAGHRLSTSALEDVVLSHPDVVDATVVGVPEPTKGEIPLCLYVTRDDRNTNEELINGELVARVRELIGPIAAFKLAAEVKGLPRTRSGKTCRKSIADLARSKQIKIPSTIEDSTVYRDIMQVLRKLGYAKTAPEPI
ncbi:unnamed protein product [Trichogramma brassicae]|uniref:acetate--CoA ligase n=1 Tax=Trichogramma brassicae TaxID=86971 RepID=A0A6H5IHU6_9HYME|nr:unnamed protein product [Trichogramma brassicae]